MFNFILEYLHLEKDHQEGQCCRLFKKDYQKIIKADVVGCFPKYHQESIEP